MESTKQYNGWNNWETWLINLHVSNDEGWTQQRDEILARFETTEDSPEDNVYLLSKELKNFIEEYLADYETFNGKFSPLIADMVNGCLDSVDWRELAETWLSDFYN